MKGSGELRLCPVTRIWFVSDAGVHGAQQVPVTPSVPGLGLPLQWPVPVCPETPQNTLHPDIVYFVHPFSYDLAKSCLFMTSWVQWGNCLIRTVFKLSAPYLREKREASWSPRPLWKLGAGQRRLLLLKSSETGVSRDWILPCGCKFSFYLSAFFTPRPSRRGKKKNREN